MPTPRVSSPSTSAREIDSGDPQVLAFLNEIEISSKVYAPLFALNEENLPASCGAESATLSADGKVYTFTIREGMTYSDGVPVTAHNYAYAIKRALSPVVAGNYSNTLYAVSGGQAWREADPAGDTAELEAVVSESIKALDDRTLQITLDFAAGYFPYVMAIWVTYPVREDLVGDDLDWWRDPAKYIGNGPFKVASHTDGQEWVFERNESYFRGVPGIKTWIFKEIDSSETELLAYQQDEFDWMGPAGSQLPQIEADPTLSGQLQRGVGASTNWFSMNNSAAPFDIVEVRQAIAAALNREQYITQISNGVGLVAGTLLYPGNPAYQEDYQQTYDEANAQALLEAAGFPGRRGVPHPATLLRGRRCLLAAAGHLLRPEPERRARDPDRADADRRGRAPEPAHEPRSVADLRHRQLVRGLPAPAELALAGVRAGHHPRAAGVGRRRVQRARDPGRPIADRGGDPALPAGRRVAGRAGAGGVLPARREPGPDQAARAGLRQLPDQHLRHDLPVRKGLQAR